MAPIWGIKISMALNTYLILETVGTDLGVKISMTLDPYLVWETFGARFGANLGMEITIALDP